MEVYLIIIARTVLLYFLIIIIFRLMGKREIGELSILDLVVFIMIAELAVMAIESPEDPLMHSIVSMLLLLAIQFGLAMLSLKSERVRTLIDGKPTIIISNGKIDEKAMKSQRYNFDDLMTQLREKDVRSLADVEFAILETSGKLNVFQKKQQEPMETLELPLIVDGTIQPQHLQKIGKSELWLRQELRKLGYQDIQNISYCSYTNGVFYVDLSNLQN
ncbi:DUF421 domain-containing protein [Bacillus sp. FJAT-42376]|uniref:DUF421 domain-containing protein n=1 Tax=Bacillus sp. FJAT-42376 TaxID=2014076 RepID=UPI000F5015E5|nr:DUF421 domain-containing protein [Bacillus sp. FJAT-42376]AZB43764.1 DUF421 domain-containing protein [Bacillus sp. FJAT-42376]